MPVIDCSNPSEFDCSSPDCQRWCVDRHEISAGLFTTMVNNYFYYPTQLPDPFVITQQQVDEVLKDVPCSAKIVFNFDEKLNHVDNTDIAPSIEFPAVTTYSIALLLGLATKFPDATEYHVFKAYAINMNTQVVSACAVFRVMKNTSILYYGDLSGLRP